MKEDSINLGARLNAALQASGAVPGQDLAYYDESFLANSAERGMAAAGIPSVAAYCAHLSGHRADAEAFRDSLAIGYSTFFRNPLTFAQLEQSVLPSLMEAKSKSAYPGLRVWSAACSSGQEAYSIAILLSELSAARGMAIPFRIFGTDLSEDNLTVARRGVYDAESVRDVRLQHIWKYFAVKSKVYRVIPAIKDLVDFSVYNLLDEQSTCPPASIYGDFDLIVCSNLLFYYRQPIRQRILGKLRKALAPGGYLVTGEAEREIVRQCGWLREVHGATAVFHRSGS